MARRANQRSCRCCHRELSDCSCSFGGGVGRRRRARRSARPRRDSDAADDRISALHDDLLLQILTRLRCAHAAARTSVLSRRWRGLWTRLPELVLREVQPHSLDAVLAQLVARVGPQARPPHHALSLLDVQAPYYSRFTLAQISSLFDAAARLQPANLIVGVTSRQPGTVRLPHLDHTKSITLEIFGVNLLLPQEQEAGVMQQLESLSFRRYDAVLGGLLHRFSALRSLSISSLHLDSITINQPLLEELFLLANVRLRQVSIIAPGLKKLTFHARGGVKDDFTVMCLAPKVDLSWECTNNYTSRVYFGDIWHLMDVAMKASQPLGQLQHTPSFNALSLSVLEQEVFVQEGALSFKNYISSLVPAENFSALNLCINSCGHVYGAMVLHLLGVYTLIERLKVDLLKFQARRGCSANCPCIQLNNWASPTVSLTHLKEMEIKGVRGEDHEIDLLKVILRSAAMLERLTITFSTKSQQRIRRFSIKIHNMLKAHPSVNCKIYRCSGEQVNATRFHCS